MRPAEFQLRCTLRSRVKNNPGRHVLENAEEACMSDTHTKPDRTRRQTQVGIGHSAPTHRGGHEQNRNRRRQVRRSKIKTGPQAEQPPTDGGPGRHW